MKEKLLSTCELINSSLETYFDSDIPQKELTQSMRYSLLAGGKRIRPVLVLSFCQAAGGDVEKALPAACAVEMLHTYSLIHDDLPCMDNDDLRRGKPTNHVVYGKCTATLAGDALQAEAFRTLLGSQLPPDRVVKMGLFLADAAGVYGICGGQILDIAAEGKKAEREEIENIHALKTASLLAACGKIGVAAAGGDDFQIECAEKYAHYLGMAFQIRDDILDVTSTTGELGKPVGSDKKSEKSTFVSLFGVEKCEELVRENTVLAVAAAEKGFKDSAFLVWLAEYLASRTK